MYLLNIPRLHAIARPAVLTAFLGYLLLIIGLLFDLGRPWFIWHQMIYLNPHSVMFEVGFCVMFYTTVLMFEFFNVFERLTGKTAQVGEGGADSAGDCGRSALDAAPVLPGHPVSDHADEAASVLVLPGAAVLLFSAVAVGLAMTIFESSLSSRAFRRQLELPVIVELGGALYVTLWVYALLRFEDFFHRGQLGNIVRPGYEAYFLWLELLLSLIIPLTILSFRKGAVGRVLAVRGSCRPCWDL